MTKKNNNIESFPINSLNEEWPFPEHLARLIFQRSSSQTFYSLREVFIQFLLNEDSDSSNEDSYSSNEDSDSSSEDVEYIYYADSWLVSGYKNFFIERNKLYYKVSETKIDLLENIPYETILCAAIKVCLRSYTKRRSNEVTLWMQIFAYLKNTNYPIKEILEEQNFIRKHKKNILKTFHLCFQDLQNRTSRGLIFTYEITETKNIFKKRFLNIFFVSEIPMEDAKILVNNFGLTKNLDEIILYYKKISFSLFKINL